MTGLGILCSCYALLHCGFDASHWQIAVYLAWFSAVTHLSGLTVLRTYLNTYPWVKHTRVFLMFALLMLLIVGLIPTGFLFARTSDHASYAICYFNLSYGYWHFSEIDRDASEVSRVEETASWQAMILSVILLVFGFITRSIRLFRPLSTAFRLRIRQPLSGWSRRSLRRLGPSGTPRSRFGVIISNIITKQALALFLMARLSCDLFSSMLFEVWYYCCWRKSRFKYWYKPPQIYWLIIILLWGTLKLVVARNVIILQGDDIAAAENQWTFGQILPVFLLLGPLFSITGIFTSRVADKSLPTVSHSSDQVQMGPVNTIIPLPDQGRLSRQVTQSSATPNLFQDDELRQHNSTHDRITSALPISISRGGDLEYLEDYSDAPWLPICVAIPFLSILLASIFLFGLSFNFFNSLVPQWSLYRIWISNYYLIYSLLIGYPCACAITIRFGLGMDLGNRWKKFGFFWLCCGIYAVPFSFLLMEFTGNK